MSFTPKAVAIAAGISALIFALSAATELHLPSALHLFNLAYFVLAMVAHRMLMKANSQSGARFITVFMGLVTVKLLFTLAALGIYLYLVKEDQAQVAIGVFIIYMAYTILEVVVMQSVLRRNKGSKKSHNS